MLNTQLTFQFKETVAKAELLIRPMNYGCWNAIVPSCVPNCNENKLSTSNFWGDFTKLLAKE